MINENKKNNHEMEKEELNEKLKRMIICNYF